MQDKDKLSKRAKRKYINTPVLNHLIDLDSPLKSRYISSLSCSSLLVQTHGQIKSRYCKRMWCTVCAPIRTAVRLNNYSAQLLQLNNIQLTTLTLPNVAADKIKSTIQHFRKVFKQFRDTFNKRENKVFKGVYNFEVTINMTSKLFHPHIHIIHEGLPITYKKNSDKALNELIEYWLKNEKSATIKAQDTRPCNDLIEGFKYQSKSVFFIKKNNKKEYVIPAFELDKLYISLVSVRCFNVFGIEKIADEVEDKALDKLTAYVSDKPDGSYMWQKNDWINYQMVDEDTGEILHEFGNKGILIETKLTDYKPNKNTEKIYDELTNNVNYSIPYKLNTKTN